MILPSFKNICISICVAAFMLSGHLVMAEEGDQQPQPDLSKWISKDANWALRLAKDEKVVYHGEFNLDNAGSHGGAGMLYPAPNAAGLLVAVFTHGVLVESSKSREKSKLQEVADKVLSPYQFVLNTFEQKDLMQRSLAKAKIGASKQLIGAADKPSDSLVVTSEPVFWMTQDQSVLILDNTISVFTPDAPSAPAYQNRVRVISRMKNASDLVKFWTASQGENLKDESASLLAESLDVVLAELGRPEKNNNPYKTVRYLEGSREQMERGQIIAKHCDRIVLKNLRGWFMSVPVGSKGSQGSDIDQCDMASASTW
jgi:hypothetical protein